MDSGNDSCKKQPSDTKGYVFLKFLSSYTISSNYPNKDKKSSKSHLGF